MAKWTHEIDRYRGYGSDDKRIIKCGDVEVTSCPDHPLTAAQVCELICDCLNHGGDDSASRLRMVLEALEAK